MSLVNEALRKAHLETLRREGPSAATAPATGLHRASFRRSRRGGAVLLAVSGFGIGLVAASLVYLSPWRKGAGATAPGEVPPVVAETAVPASESKSPEKATPEPAAHREVEPGSAVLVSTDSEPPPAAPEATEQAAPRTAEPPATTPAQPAVESAAPREARRRPEAAAPRATPRASAGPLDGRTYRGSAPTPAGGTIHLSGISSFGDRHLAFLDGKLVKPGDRVAGFTVVRIESQGLELSWESGSLFLSM